MPFMKVDFFFSCGESGWDETIYFSAIDGAPVSKYDQALNAAKLLGQDRQALLAFPAFIKAIRVSDVDVTKDSVLIPAQNWDIFPSPNTSDTPWQALLVRLGNGGLYWRPLYMRGIPDALWNGFRFDITNTTVQLWLSKFETWRQRLFADDWRIRVASKNPSDAPEKQITSLVLAAGTLSVSNVPDSKIVAGDKVVFYQRGFRPPLGRRTALVASAGTTFEVSYAGTRDSTAALGRVKRIVIGYVRIDNANYERIVHRDTGRPYGLQRGRRGKKVC